MDIFVFSDESGVFDCYHSTYFVFGGLAFLDRMTMESAARRYLTIENSVVRVIPSSFLAVQGTRLSHLPAFSLRLQ